MLLSKLKAFKSKLYYARYRPILGLFGFCVKFSRYIL